jgi:hypothetical protein
MNNSIEVVFIEDREKVLKVSELSEFLYNLKVFYSVAFEKFGEKFDVEEHPERIVNIAKDIAHTLKTGKYFHFLYRYRDDFFRKNLRDKDVFIAKICKESPLTIWFMGVSTILVAAFIISGGEIEISTDPPKIRIKMNSIAEGLKKIKKVFEK